MKWAMARQFFKKIMFVWSLVSVVFFFLLFQYNGGYEDMKQKEKSNMYVTDHKTRKKQRSKRTKIRKKMKSKT